MDRLRRARRLKQTLAPGLSTLNRQPIGDQSAFLKGVRGKGSIHCVFVTGEIRLLRKVKDSLGPWLGLSVSRQPKVNEDASKASSTRTERPVAGGSAKAKDGMSAEHDELAEAEWWAEADKAWSDEAWQAKRKRMLAAPWQPPEPTADPNELWRAFVRDFRKKEPNCHS